MASERPALLRSDDGGTRPAVAAGAGGGDVTVEQVPRRKRKPLTPEQLAVSLGASSSTGRGRCRSSGFLGFFGMSSLSFLWPKLTGGFGTMINAGNYDDIIAQIGPEGGLPAAVHRRGSVLAHLLRRHR